MGGWSPRENEADLALRPSGGRERRGHGRAAKWSAGACLSREAWRESELWEGGERACSRLGKKWASEMVRHIIPAQVSTGQGHLKILLTGW